MFEKFPLTFGVGNIQNFSEQLKFKPTYVATLNGGHRSGPALDRWLLRACLWLPLIALLLFFGAPMLMIAWRSLIDDVSGGVGLDNYLRLLDTPGVWRAVGNSLTLGLSTTLLTVLLGFVVAYGIERTAMPGNCVSATATVPS